MISDRLTKRATLHRWQRGPKDDLGDYTSTFQDVSVYASVQQQTAWEVGREKTAVSILTVFIRPNVTAVSPLDEITVNGVRYAFYGEPYLITNPRTGVNSHWLGRLRQVS